MCDAIEHMRRVFGSFPIVKVPYDPEHLELCWCRLDTGEYRTK